VRHGDELMPEYVNGDNFRLFASLRIPMGQGLSGWVAQNLKPILNGNPSVEPGYLNDASIYSTLTSALAVPLEGLQGVVGVVALYHAEKDFFTSDHLRILLAVSSKMGLAIENARKYEQAESSAVTDYLTGLPNARSLFVQLDRELARCKRDNRSLTVMVSDLDGFKQINDRFGHLEGNRVLRLFAHSLKETSREYDYVARMGGDELVGIVTNLSLGGCYVESGSLLLPGSKLKLTFSHEHTNVTVAGEVVRMDMGIGAALKFIEATHEVRAAVQRMLEQLAAAEAVIDLKRSHNAAAGGKL